MYEVIFSISLIIELGDIGSIYNDTVLWLYIIYCFLYIFPLIVLFKIRHEKKSFVNSETIDGTDRDEP
jgi:hypothetical protein